MSSTNKTTHYNLSQFIGSDKPAWLTDYNADMNKIDTGINSAQSSATAADGKADSANTSIGTLSNLTTTSKTNLVSAINEVDSNADTAQSTANSAVTASATNTNKLSTLEAYLDLSTFVTPTLSTTNFNNTTSGDYVTCASNSTGSLGKIYGQIRGISQGTSFTITFPTPFHPDTALTINGIVRSYFSTDGTSNWTPLTHSITIGTDGTATLQVSNTLSGRYYRFQIDACLLFIKSFGDIPVEN